MDESRYFPPPGEFGPPPPDRPTPSRWPRVALVVTLLLLVVGGIALAVVLLLADGEEGTPGEAAPTDASTEDFCAAMRELDVVSGEVPGQEAIDAYAEGLAETGTPEDIPDEARAGFELFVDALDEIEVSGSPRSMARELGSQLMGAEFVAFVRYTSATCS